MAGRHRAARGIRLLVIVAAASLTLASGCRQDMHDQPKYKPLRKSAFFDDARQARPLVEGTVARGHLYVDDAYHTGKGPEGFVRSIPVPVTAELLARGRERYGIYCTPCHDRTGSGSGMIVRRGYPKPASFHEQRIREAAAGYFFNAITNGFGVMPSYALQVPVADRWAIVAYVRALQLSQRASLEDIPAALRSELDAPSGAAARQDREDAQDHGHTRGHP